MSDRATLRHGRVPVAITLSLLLLAACGGAPATPAATTAPAAAATTAPAAPAATTAPAAPAATTAPAATSAPAAAATGGELNVAITGDVVKIDPAFTYDFTTSQVVNQITEGLLRFKDGSTLEPNLAESFANPDPKTYTYKIRKGVTFQDGSPMTVDDVVFSLNRTRAAETASYVGWMFANVDTIAKDGEDTVKVTLKQPDALWQYVPATTAGHVISQKHYQAAPKDKYGTPEYGALGTGPFKFVSWTTGSEVVLQKYDGYWNKANGGPYVDKIVYKILPEATTRTTGLQNGQLDFVLGGVAPDQLPVVQKMPNVTIAAAESYYNDFIAFNTQRKPFDNLKFRQALNYAVDKKAVFETAVGDAGTVARAVPVSPRMWVFNKDLWQAAYDKLPAYARDLAQAKQLLAESGVTAADASGKSILTDEDPVRLGQALALQAAAKELGIDFEIKKVTNQELNTTGFAGARDYDMLVTPWGSDFPDPSGNLLPVFNSANVGDGGSNFANYKNPDLDKLLLEQNTLTDNTKRTELLIKAEQIVADESVWIVFGHQKQVLVTAKNVTGYTPNPLWYWDAFLKDVKKG